MSTQDERNKRLGNEVRVSGADRCYCGCKYWENDQCIDCGGTLPMPEDEPTMSIAQFLYEVGPSLAWKKEEQALWLRIRNRYTDVMSNETITCQWFAMCDHDAVGTTKHPVLGDVPIRELLRRQARPGGRQPPSFEDEASAASTAASSKLAWTRAGAVTASAATRTATRCTT